MQVQVGGERDMREMREHILAGTLYHIRSSSHHRTGLKNSYSLGTQQTSRNRLSICNGPSRRRRMPPGRNEAMFPATTGRRAIDASPPGRPCCLPSTNAPGHYANAHTRPVQASPWNTVDLDSEIADSDAPGETAKTNYMKTWNKWNWGYFIKYANHWLKCQNIKGSSTARLFSGYAWRIIQTWKTENIRVKLQRPPGPWKRYSIEVH